MFGKNKKRDDGENSVIPPMIETGNMQAQTPKPKPEPTLLDILHARRREAVVRANLCDEQIAALDAEITWVERHPGSQAVMKEFLQDEFHKFRRDNLAQPCPSCGSVANCT